MNKIILALVAGFLFIGANVFADDVSIDSSGNVKTGVSNANAELEVTGASGEGGILGSASGTGASGVYGINTTSGNYGILGYDSYGVFGYSSDDYAGYFQGNALVTGNLTVDGSIIGPLLGDITGVTAGTGLSGGGSSGDVTLNADTAYLQRRVTGTCVGQVMVGISSDGTVSCETDDAGLSSETDPQVGNNTANYIPKWDGSALVSGSMYDNNGDIGIGTSIPSGALEVVRDQVTPIIRLTGYNIGAGSPVMFVGRRARGTIDSPSAVQANDVLAGFAGSGYGANSWPGVPTTRGRVDITAAENWTDTAQGAYIAFRTTPVGSINSAEIMRINDAGNVGIGTTAPNEQLEITGNLRLPVTTSTTGIIKSGANTLIHTFGTQNFFAGIGAGNLTTTGSSNVAVGYHALINNTTGFGNTANGEYALHSNTTGSGNSSVGDQALYSNTSGGNNVAIGYAALGSNTTANGNVAIGEQALANNTTGYGNTAIGSSARVLNNTYWNATAIGNGAVVDAPNKVVIGNTSVTSIGGYTGWSNFSDQRVKTDIQDIEFGLDIIKSLRPVQYKMKNGNNNTDFGFIAQDIEALLGEKYNLLDIGGGDERMLSLRYTQFIAPMVKAIQEQQEMIESQQEQINELKAMIEEFKKRS